MRILVTGANGFLGSHVMKHMAEAHPSAEIVAADADSLDVRDGAACRKRMQRVQPTHVVHAAAVTLTDESAASLALTMSVNLEGTRNVLDAAVAAGSIERFLLVSSSGVYAQIEGSNGLCDEEQPLDLTTSYARSKREAELLMAEYEDAGKFIVLAARVGPAYGEFERRRVTRPKISMVQQMLDCLPEQRTLLVAGSDTRRDWTHADDVARALDGLLFAPVLKHRIYNVSAGLAVSARRLLEVLVTQGLYVAWTEDESVADFVLNAKQDRAALDIARLQQDTGFTPRFDIRTGIAQVIAAQQVRAVSTEESRMNEITTAFDRYYNFDEMTAELKALAAAYPKLATLTSLAKSFAGRDIWVVEITNPETGLAAEKPGYYIDAQIHAEEHATSATALYAVWHLLVNYGKDEEVTRLVDSQVFYIIPRINPDGAELSLVPPYYNWCGNGRFMPGADRIEGLIPEDINGDGYIVWMRVPDTKGEWKKSTQNPDVMVQRKPGEEGGSYYRLYPEGSIRDFDGADIKVEKPFDGNMNRNFPTNWSPQEYGAGTHPMSEPEVAGVAKFILDHPNICGMCAYHTHGGIILRPSMTKPDAAMGARDINLYKEIGKVGTEITGYPTISIYEEFTPDKTKARRGGLMDWTYEELGIISFGTELWDLERTAGVDKVDYLNLFPRTEDIQHKIYAYIKEHVGERGWRPWEAFEHPQLGAVELGGMVNIWSYRNPPEKLLEEICRQNVLFNLRHAAASPRLKVDEVTVIELGEGLYKVRAVASNHGYLPTNLSDVAIANLVAKPVRLSIEVEGGDLVMNPQSADLGNLAGRNERLYPWSPWGQQWTATTKAIEWLVKVPAKGRVTVTGVSEKAGTHRVTRQIG